MKSSILISILIFYLFAINVSCKVDCRALEKDEFSYSKFFVIKDKSDDGRYYLLKGVTISGAYGEIYGPDYLLRRPYEKAQIGDTLRKEKGSATIYIFKRNHVKLVFPFTCDT